MIQDLRYSPIAIFAYNRPEHLANCLDSLIKCPEASESDVFIFVDGPKAGHDREKVQKNLRIAAQIRGFRSVEIVTREVNLGLAESIKSGVSAVLNEYENIIVLEDDLMVSSSFLKYMNSALNHYHSNSNVFSIQGSNYFSNGIADAPFFLLGADCWGWATWKDRWSEIAWDPILLAKEMRESEKLEIFNVHGSYNHLEILDSTSMGVTSSWAIIFHAYAILKNKVSLYPHKSQVTNIGADGQGTNMGSDLDYSSELYQVDVWMMPPEILHNENAFALLELFHRTSMKSIPRWKILFYPTRRRFHQFRKSILEVAKRKI